VFPTVGLPTKVPPVPAMIVIIPFLLISRIEITSPTALFAPPGRAETKELALGILKSNAFVDTKIPASKICSAVGNTSAEKVIGLNGLLKVKRPFQFVPHFHLLYPPFRLNFHFLELPNFLKKEHFQKMFLKMNQRDPEHLPRQLSLLALVNLWTQWNLGGQSLHQRHCFR
jgi:hypothetical protein